MDTYKQLCAELLRARASLNVSQSTRLYSYTIGTGTIDLTSVNPNDFVLVDSDPHAPTDEELIEIMGQSSGEDLQIGGGSKLSAPSSPAVANSLPHFYPIIMTDENYPVPVPSDLVSRLTENSLLNRRDLVLRAYQEGANAELEACCKVIDAATVVPLDSVEWLRNARRPKQKSKKEQALEDFNFLMSQEGLESSSLDISARARRVIQALESLPD